MVAVPDLTLKRMDDLIRRELRKTGGEFEGDETSNITVRCSFGDLRQLVATGIALATEVEPVMDLGSYDFNAGQREGRDRTRAAIKKRAAWLRKEMKANAAK